MSRFHVFVASIIIKADIFFGWRDTVANWQHWQTGLLRWEAAKWQHFVELFIEWPYALGENQLILDLLRLLL